MTDNDRFIEIPPLGDRSRAALSPLCAIMPHALHSGKRRAFFHSAEWIDLCQHAAMILPDFPLCTARLRLGIVALGAIFFSSVAPCMAACAPPDLGEGHVAEIIDGRSFRLSDGREIRLAGIEPADTTKADRIAALSAVIADHDVMLRGPDDAPDRYGRQNAFVYLAPDDKLVQAELVASGHALVSPELDDRDCAALLMTAESEARQAQRGTWAGNSVIKNAESPDDILAGIGRFTVVEGTVLSVHQSGATTYLNFGRSWTRDFAVTISRRVQPALAAAGLAPKSLENKRIRVRGWVEARQGPRIEIVRVGQIEVLGGQ